MHRNYKIVDIIDLIKIKKEQTESEFNERFGTHLWTLYP